MYLNNNRLTGSYRRNGEGDYKCTREEVDAMVRDSAVEPQDAKILETRGLDVIDYETVERYRNMMKITRPGHVWISLPNEEFLHKLGALGRSEDGKLHPTKAGLLMFGYEYEITLEYPNYFLDYQEKYDERVRWTDRIISTSGEWSGNLFDFYFRAYNKMSMDLKVPFKMVGIMRIDDTPVHKALREALANCLVNADYYGRQGVVIIRKKDSITLSNPGAFRIDVEIAKAGGISDPRNPVLLKMFNFIDIGERAGSGIPNIYSVWQQQGWNPPIIEERLNPDRTILSLDLRKTGGKGVTIKSDDKKRR